MSRPDWVILSDCKYITVNILLYHHKIITSTFGHFPMSIAVTYLAISHKWRGIILFLFLMASISADGGEVALYSTKDFTSQRIAYESQLIALEVIKAASTDNCNPRIQRITNWWLICGSMYNTLGILPWSTSDEVRAAAVSRRYELCVTSFCDKRAPQLHHSESQLAYKLIEDSRKCLSDNGCREDYDRHLKEKTQQVEQEFIASNLQRYSKSIVHRLLENLVLSQVVDLVRPGHMDFFRCCVSRKRTHCGNG